MKQNLANRLAAGGFWAMQIAQLSVEVAHELSEHGHTIPIGSGSDTEVFITCGVGAFNQVVNVYMPDNLKINAQIKFMACFDKYGMSISQDEWRLLMESSEYRRIAVWHSNSGDAHVSTIWTGMDIHECKPPHIFETVVVHIDGHRKPHITKKISSHTIAEADQLHQYIVEQVKAGKL